MESEMASAECTNAKSVSNTFDSHPVYSNDPRKLHSLIHSYISVTVRNQKPISGWVHTVDPVSESFVLVNFTADGSTVQDVILVPGYNVTGVRLHPHVASENMKEKIDFTFKQNETRFSRAELDRRRNVLCVWLKDNRVPYTMKANDCLEVLRFATIKPPYTPQSIVCTNEVVLDKLLKLLQDCPQLIL
ncbi:gem-associated protein 6 [Hyalella azteca]|uniref:Gem-associated protein 6 n=1 Tax=Hyalella azteca TaxID=294128 RepID=A0A8B7PNA1_HYAAZ|nr:gem-associated protein 6 [Hyalella azteca]